MTSSLHVAFLRGVGGPKPARGEEVRTCFAAGGYDRITPVMATGNVVFGLGRKRKPPEEEAISAMIERHFGYPLPAILRSGEAVTAMVADDPFRRTDRKRLTGFVAFLAADAPPADALPDIPRDAGYALVARHDRDLFFTIDRALVRTPDVMAVLERTFRKRLTTRVWATVEKVAAAVALVERI